jgi:hypothetical protein
MSGTGQEFDAKTDFVQQWLSTKNFQTWARDAEDRGEYQNRLMDWLTFVGLFPAHYVAILPDCSEQAVYLWEVQQGEPFEAII